MLRDNERKFEELPEDQMLSKLCCGAGLKIVEIGQFSITLDEEEGPDGMKNSCREYTLPRTEPQSLPRGWIIGNTEIGPVLDVNVCDHQKRYGIEIMIKSLFHDKTTSWVRIVNGIDKYVTETSETVDLEIFEHKDVTGKPVARAKPQLKPSVTLSLVSIPVRDRKWIDIETPRFDQKCFAVSKVMIRLLRHHPSIPRQDDGAVHFDDIMKEFEAKFDGSSQWSVHDWITCLAKGGGHKKRFKYCLNTHSSKLFLYFRAIQGHSGNSLVDPTLHDNTLLPEDVTEYIFHVGSVSEIFSIVKSGLIPAGKSLKGERHSVFFTAVNPNGR